MSVTISIPGVLGLLHSLLALLAAFAATASLGAAIHDADWTDAVGAALFGTIALVEMMTAGFLFGWWA